MSQVFDNIIQGFNNYKNKTIKAIDNKDFENKMLGFLKEAALLILNVVW